MAVSKRKTDLNQDRTASYIGKGIVAPVAGGGVVLDPLGPTVAAFTAGVQPGTLVAAITGLGSGETISAIAPNDGRFAIASGNRIVVGASAATAGSIAATVTTSTGRTLSLTVTVAAVTSGPQFAPYTGLVATNAGGHTDRTTNTSRFYWEGASIHRSTENVAPQVIDSGFYGNNEAVPDSAVNIYRSIEYPIGTTPQRITAGGAQMGVIPAGGFLTWDVAPVVVPKDAEYKLHYNCAMATPNATFAYGSANSGMTILDIARGERYAESTGALPDKTLTTGSTGTATQRSFRPFAIVGTTTKPTVGILGADSIAFGVRDTVPTAAPFGNLGYAHDVGENYAYSNLAVAGATALVFSTNFNLRRKILDYTTDVVMNNATNDSGSTSTILGYVQASIAAVKSYKASIKVIYASRLPRTTSTDNWVTSDNQSEINAGTRKAINDALDAKTPGNDVHWNVEAIMCVPKPSDSTQSVFPPVGGVASVSTDGLHPLASAYKKLEDSNTFKPIIETLHPFSSGGEVVLDPLGPLTATYMAGQTAGSLVTPVTGLAAEETIATLLPNDGRLALDTGRRNILVGLLASTAGIINATVTTSFGRTLALPITGAATLAISGTPAQATVGTAYTFTPTITGGFGPYTLVASSLLTGTQITDSGTNAPKIAGTSTEAQALTGIMLTVTDSRGNTASISGRNLTSVLPASLTTEAVGRMTRSGVKIAQLPAGSAISGGTNSTHFAIDAAGAVTVSSAGQTAGLQVADYNLAISGSDVTNLIIPTEANTFDVTNHTQAGAAVTAALAASATTDWRIMYRNGTVASDFATFTAVFSGTITDPNTNILASLAGQQALNRNKGIATVSGGSFTLSCRTQYGSKWEVGPSFSGCGPVVVENIDFTRTPTGDTYDAKFTQVTQGFLWKPELSISKTSAVTISQASPGVVSWTAHGLKANYPVVFTNSGGALPTGITAGTTYYVGTVPDANTFTLRTQPLGNTNGLAVNTTSAGSGTHTATTTAGAVIGVLSIQQNGAGYLASTNVRRAYIATRAAGSGSGFSGWFDINDDGTIDATSPLTIVAVGSAYDAAAQFRQPTVSEGIPISLQQTDTFLTGNSVQFNMSANGTVKPSGIIRNNRFGNASGNTLRYTTCMSIRNFSRLIIENNVLSGFYKGIQIFAGDNLDIRHNELKNYVNDGIDYYPSTTLVAGQVTLLSRIHDNVFHSLSDGDFFWSNSHSDPIQIGSGGDLQAHETLEVFNIIYTPADVQLLNGQGFQHGDTTKNIKHRTANNLVVMSTTNALLMWRCDAGDPSDAGFNTVVRQRRTDATIFGTQDFPGTIRPAAAGGYRIHHNIVGEVWDALSGDRYAYDPAGGSRVGGGAIGTYYSDNNGYLSELTPNTGAGNSYPEVFAGGTAAFVWKGSLIGFEVAPGKVRTDTVANLKADLAAIFAIKPGAAAAYQGKGYLAVAS